MITYAAQILHSPQYRIIFDSPLFCNSKTRYTQNKLVQQVGQSKFKVYFLISNKSNVIIHYNTALGITNEPVHVCFNGKFKVHPQYACNPKIFFRFYGYSIPSDRQFSSNFNFSVSVMVQMKSLL